MNLPFILVVTAVLLIGTGLLGRRWPVAIVGCLLLVLGPIRAGPGWDNQRSSPLGHTSSPRSLPHGPTLKTART